MSSIAWLCVIMIGSIAIVTVPSVTVSGEYTVLYQSWSTTDCSGTLLLSLNDPSGYCKDSQVSGSTRRTCMPDGLTYTLEIHADDACADDYSPVSYVAGVCYRLSNTLSMKGMCNHINGTSVYQPAAASSSTGLGSPAVSSTGASGPGGFIYNPSGEQWTGKYYASGCDKSRCCCAQTMRFKKAFAYYSIPAGYSIISSDAVGATCKNGPIEVMSALFADPPTNIAAVGLYIGGSGPEVHSMTLTAIGAITDTNTLFPYCSAQLSTTPPIRESSSTGVECDVKEFRCNGAGFITVNLYPMILSTFAALIIGHRIL